jgi:4'-phosphopantetheinyl transferase
MNTSLPLRQLPHEKAIDVWLIQLDCPLKPGVDLDGILSEGERKRADRFVRDTDAFRFRLCRAMLRLGVAWYLQKTPQEITFTTGKHGKPRLTPCSSLHFNVTHSRELALVAFTTIGEVGIDVESIEHGIEALDIASANFTRNEAAMIAAARTPHEQIHIFLRLWTRKEAVFKAAGIGILHGLDTVDVSRESPSVVDLRSASVDIAESSWLVSDLELAGGFMGAIAAPPADWSIVLWPICADDLINCFATSFPGL